MGKSWEVIKYKFWKKTCSLKNQIIKANKKYYPQTLSEECKYEQKIKTENYIDEDFKSESDTGNDNNADTDTDNDT